VHRIALSLPAGLTLEVPRLRSCSARHLEAHGPAGCPSQALVGRGHALAEALAGSETLSEEVTLWAFIGPPQGNTPTVELDGEGSTPVPAQVVITGTVVPARAPYGEQLVLPVPPVPSLPSVSETSLANLTLTIGTHGPHPARNANTVIVPKPCPAGGYPFAAAFTYADGSSDSAFAKVPCPAKATRRRSRSTKVKIKRHHGMAKPRTASLERRPGPIKARSQTKARARTADPRASSARTVSLHESRTADPRASSARTVSLHESRTADPRASSARTVSLHESRTADPRASSAGTVSLHESGNLRLITKHGFVLNEQGSASGTFSGTIHVRLTIVSTNHVKAAVSISRSGGSISGEASASYHRGAASASFTGSLSVSGGTGSYSHVHGSGLSFAGTIQNSNDAIAVRLSGPISG
jgi:hypothetical protein